MKRKPKAMEITADQKKRALLVPGASERAVRTIAEIVSSQKQNIEEWKVFKRNVLQPLEASFDTIYLKKKDGSNFAFLCASPTKTLEIYGGLYEFRTILSKTSGQELHVIIYHDEVTAGNVLAPLKHQKATLFYVGFLDSRFNLL